jgi:predicted O-methyltransferase YrrM
MKNKSFVNNYFRHVRRKYRSLLGIKSNRIGVTKCDMVFLEHIITENQQLVNFVEFGTFGGYTSLLFGMMARMREAPFYTIDIKDFRTDVVKKAWLPNMWFLSYDLLSEINPKVVSLIEKENTFLFIDNGNKKQEVNMYCDFIKPGSIMAVHDWESEVFMEDIYAALTKNNMVPLFEDVAKEINPRCRCWIKNV